MTIEPIIDQDTAMHYAQWALDAKLWDGREIDPNRVKDAVIEKIALELFSKDPDSYAFQKMVAELAYLGAQEGEEEEIAAELASLQAFQNGVVISAGFCKSLKKFWKKHKVEILVGIAVVAVVTAVAVGVLCVAGATAAGALAAESDKDKKDPPKPVPSTTSEENTTGNSSTQSPWPLIDLALEKEAVVFNGQSLSYCDALQPKTIAQTLYSRAGEDGLWKVYHASLPESVAPFVRSVSNIPASESFQSIQQTSSIPVFSSKNYPPETDKSAWVFKMIDWGLSDNDFETTPMPVLENAYSQVFRTVGTQRKDLAVSGINGINTSLHGSIQHAEYLAQFTKGLSVTWVHNHSNSLIVDAVECVTVNLPGASPNTQNLEKDQWIAFHEANRDNPDAKFLQFCHSQGTIHTKNTLKNVPKEIQQRIIVMAIAPAVIITDDLCYKSFNYASKNDKVYLAEMTFTSAVNIERGREALENLDHLVLLDPHEDAPAWDHDLESPTFRQVILDRLDEYLRLK